MGEFAAAHLQRVRHIGQRLFGVRLQMGGEFGTLFVERLGAVGGQDQQLPIPMVIRSAFGVRCLLYDYVGIGTADPERTDAGAAWLSARARPILLLGVDVERAIDKVDFGIGCGKMQHRRDMAVAHGQQRFDQAGRTGGRIEVADIALD